MEPVHLGDLSQVDSLGCALLSKSCKLLFCLLDPSLFSLNHLAESIVRLISILVFYSFVSTHIRNNVNVLQLQRYVFILTIFKFFQIKMTILLFLSFSSQDCLYLRVGGCHSIFCTYCFPYIKRVV